MAGTKAKNKAPGKVKHMKTSTQTLLQSHKKSLVNLKSIAARKVSTSGSRASMLSSTGGFSRRATVQDSDDDDDDEQRSHVGGSLDADGDVTMEAMEEAEDSEGEPVAENEDSEISESSPGCCIMQC
jgi:hypothetical protein